VVFLRCISWLVSLSISCAWSFIIFYPFISLCERVRNERKDKLQDKEIMTPRN